MRQILRLKIDCTKIDKTALFKGKKGTYLDAAVILGEETDKYGNDGMIVQDLGKDRRTAGERGAILGNARWAQQAPKQAEPAKQPPFPGDDADAGKEADVMPF